MQTLVRMSDVRRRSGRGAELFHHIFLMVDDVDTACQAAEGALVLYARPEADAVGRVDVHQVGGTVDAPDVVEQAVAADGHGEVGVDTDCRAPSATKASSSTPSPVRVSTPPARR